ncbi:MAG: hypothetical protein IPG32_21440 [Saprospirales bacterium]|nr:hypothetical protein [Saprospirales bacterium]
MIHKYYEGTPQIINLSTEIGRLLGVVDATHLRKPQTELRKKNKIKTIRASLGIEGNTLSEDQITAIMDNKRVIGPSKDIKEVENAIQAYDNLSNFDALSKESYLEADGNGRMGRLWQTVILMKANPVFEYLPIEQEIKKSQEEYYNVLSQCDKEGLSTKFVEYLLGKIKLSLAELVDTQREHFSLRGRRSPHWRGGGLRQPDHRTGL